MDPITQGAVGATASRLFAAHRFSALAVLIGVLSGMAADLDVLIQSPTDPLLFLEYHRHFTHALAFIPIGGWICALLMHLFIPRIRQAMRFRTTWLLTTLGYATHGLLDACTTYGTQLFWPFSDVRIAWNIISIIDPAFTLVIIALLWLSVKRDSRFWALMTVVYALAYLALGYIQHQRAYEVGAQLAAQRGHEPVKLSMKPSFANLIVWKSVYAHEGEFYVDAVRVARDSRIYPGAVISVFDSKTDAPWLDQTSQQAHDISRFDWFSNGYVGIDAQNPNRLTDVRFSIVPNEITGLWGIELDKDALPSEHVAYYQHHGDGASRVAGVRKLWAMLLGREINEHSLNSEMPKREESLANQLINN
ncbi:MAG: metal-dependent hydrolase [Pseudomonadota bacterium]|nr:metal-dependent hydrolase [Pseudomonadota bacterium]